MASYKVRDLGTTLSNFAASDKSVFHGFENIHFGRIKYRSSERIYLHRANSKVCLCTTNCHLSHKDPCPERGYQSLRSRD
ncbi:hypothetical protein [Porphyromonas gingivicanis]|uniref:hypothetical protein n=1 Tax=Porphyromonas gingivicanis TaxID=266762 RepID=UPI001900EA09|nr:hypothetical protein [Porphyromonas gingivicanis]